MFEIDGQFLGFKSKTGRTATEEWKPGATSMAVEFSTGVPASFLSAVAERIGPSSGYDVRVGMAWEAADGAPRPLEMYTSYDRWHYPSRPEPVRRFRPVVGFRQTGTLPELKADIYRVLRRLRTIA